MMKPDLLIDEAPSGESFCGEAAWSDGPAVRKQLAEELGASEFRELLAAFAEDLRYRFSDLEVAGLTSDSCQIGSVAGMLGFSALGLAVHRLKIACGRGEGVAEALAHVAIAQRDVIRTISLEAGGNECF
jgi:hypothetical protein